MQVSMSLDITVAYDGALTSAARLDKALSPNGTDLTESFKNYCNQENLPLDTKENIEQAAIKYAKENKL